MSNLSTVSQIRKIKPFVDTEQLKIVTYINDENKITRFEVTRIIKKKKVVREFIVNKDWNILKAWKEVEEFCKDLK